MRGEDGRGHKEQVQLFRQTDMGDYAQCELHARCPKCQQLFSGPRILPCLHTVCAPCLHKLEPLSTLGSREDWVTQQSFLCPVCDTEVLLPAGGVGELIPDLLAEGEVLLEQLRIGGHQMACDLCGDGRAEKRCQDCSVNVCEFCCQAHRRQKRTAGHKLLPLRDLPPGSSLAPTPCCSDHPSEVLRLYCKSCALPSCRDCALIQHQGHVLQPISEAIGKHREQMDKALRETDPQLGELEVTLGKVSKAKESLRQRADILREEVEAFTEGYVQAVQEHKTRLLKDIDEEVRQRTQALSLQGARLQQKLSDLRTATSFTQSLLGGGPDLHLLRVQGLVLSRLRELRRGETRTANLEEVKEITFRPQEAAGLFQGYQMYGAVKRVGADPQRSEILREGLSPVLQGQSCRFTLICKDASGELLGHGGDQPDISVIHKQSDRSIKPSVLDNHDGTYHVSYTPTNPGELSVGVRVRGRHIQGSPFTVTVQGRSRQHPGIFHCCTFCSSEGQKDARCGCGGTMPGGYKGCGHGHKGHPGRSHWSCCGCTVEKSECRGVKDTPPRSLLRTVAL
ncbi:tripartite motif-containing protein 45 [Bombina bombina]|uniref:tripartite motif-containing protein 45 n=1 Tax=Bombina bombina TaxID=8345 RepID=UPI00235AFC69|nr:tripartite motif-containing protein 45 [Bombina bombina]